MAGADRPLCGAARCWHVWCKGGMACVDGPPSCKGEWRAWRALVHGGTAPLAELAMDRCYTSECNSVEGPPPWLSWQFNKLE